MSKKTSPEKIKWTVLFIVHAVLEKTRVYAERLFSELLQANIDPDNVQVFVLHDTYDYDNSTDVYANLYEIKWDKDLRINKKEKCEDLGKLNVTTVKVLSDVLEHVQIKTKESDEQWEEANYQKYKISRKFILVTWDHSNGFGFFDTAQSFVQINRSRKPDMLMVNELQKAIKDQLSKIELLLMMNCWMQSIEAGYQLRDVVEFLIGPETTFDFLGYDYISFISEISKNPDIKEENLVTKIINDIPEKFKRFEQSRQTEVSIDDMIIAATRPKYATRIKKIVDELAEVLMEKLNTDSKDDDLDNLKKILQARTACYEITEENIGTPWYFVDIFEVVKNLHEQSHFHFITKEICDKFDSGFGDYFITTTRSSEKLSPDLKDMQGISICFPYKNDAFTIGEIYKTYYSANSNSEKKIAFAIEESGRPSKWALFLDTLLEAVKKQVKIAASKKATALALPIQRKRKALTVDEILSPPENKKFVLDIHVEFEIIATNLLVHSVIANCASSDMNGNEIIFNVNPGIGNPKSYGPGNPKSYGPGNPKSYGPGNPKSYGPGIPGELTTSPDSEKQKELLDGYGYKLVDGSGAEL